MPRSKKMAVLQVSPEVFRQFLQLPPEAEVLRVEAVPGHRGGLHVVIEGAGWSTAEGGPIPPAYGVVTTERSADGQPPRHCIDWGFPAEG